MFGNSKRLDWCRNGASERGVGWRRRDEDTDSRLSEHNFQCYNRHRLLPPSTLQHFQVQRSETKKKFWWNPKIKTWLVLRIEHLKALYDDLLLFRKMNNNNSLYSHAWLILEKSQSQNHKTSLFHIDAIMKYIDKSGSWKQWKLFYEKSNCLHICE